MKKKILVAQQLPQDVMKKLEDTFETILCDGNLASTISKLVKEQISFEGLVCTPSIQIGADIIEILPESVKIISTYSVGYEHIDVQAATDRDIVVSHTPDVLSDATADIALLLMLGASRRAYEGERLIREDQWKGWEPDQLLGVGLQGKTLGILGMGRIGQAVADRARAFGMKVHYHNRNPKDTWATYEKTAEGLLKISDVLSLHFPLNEHTHKFLNTERLAMMPKGAIIVNTARGPVIDDDALIAALKSGQIFAAGLDVFDGEPNIHPAYRDLPNTFLLPHLGSATQETRFAMGEMVFANLEAGLNGQALPNQVKP
jgi:lactate dehydrogenase-like 2-hydroxyacid dehydrogenase